MFLAVQSISFWQLVDRVFPAGPSPASRVGHQQKYRRVPTFHLSYLPSEFIQISNEISSLEINDKRTTTEIFDDATRLSHVVFFRYF